MSDELETGYYQDEFHIRTVLSSGILLIVYRSSVFVPYLSDRGARLIMVLNAVVIAACI